MDSRDLLVFVALVFLSLGATVAMIAKYDSRFNSTYSAVD